MAGDTPLVHHFDALTGEYMASAEARMDPRRPGRVVVPAHATRNAPPAVGEGQTAVFRDGLWRVVADRRGETWWDAEGQAHVIGALGEEPPAGAVLIAPPSPAHRHDGAAWTLPPAYPSAEAAKDAVLAWMTAFETSITGKVTEGERTSWRDQEPAAHAILAGEADHPGYALIDAMRAITGETRPELAERIAARAAAYRALIGPLVGYRRTIFAAIDAAEDLLEVEAVTADGLDQLTQFATAAAGGAP